MTKHSSNGNNIDADQTSAATPQPLGNEAESSISFTFGYDAEEEISLAQIQSSAEETIQKSQLTQAEKELLETCEREIEKGMEGFYAVGKYLFIVKSKKLFREQYSSFEEYCEQEWGICRVHANRQIQASQVVDDLMSEPIGTVATPKNEAQARILNGLSKKQKVAVAKEVKEMVKGREPTAKDWEQAKQKILSLPSSSAKSQPSKNKTKKTDKLEAIQTKENASDQLVEVLDTAKTIARKNGFDQDIIAGIEAVIKLVAHQKKELQKAA